MLMNLIFSSLVTADSPVKNNGALLTSFEALKQFWLCALSLCESCVVRTSPLC